MDYFTDIYLRRLNRFGSTYQERIQGQRIENFERYKLKSIYKVDFLDPINNSEKITGILEPYKQDETQTLYYLLVSLDKEWEGGTIIEIGNRKLMIFYKEDLVASGYNRYIVIKMSHLIKWKDRNKEYHESYAYFYGPMTEKIYDMLKTYLRGVVYNESNKYTHLIMPKNNFLLRQDYIEIEDEAFEVTGYDKVSTPGVMFVTLNETYIHDNSPIPDKGSDDSDEDFFWLEGV